MIEAELADGFIFVQDNVGEYPAWQLESAVLISDTAACVWQSVGLCVIHQYHSAGLMTPATALSYEVLS